MPSLLELPAELRYVCLENVVDDLFKPDDPPNLNLLDPKEWRKMELEYAQPFLPPIRLHVHEHIIRPPMSLLLASKTFHHDTTHIWNALETSLLPVIISLDCVTDDVGPHRRLTGILVKILSKAPTVSRTSHVEVRVRYFDHRGCRHRGYISLARPISQPDGSTSMASFKHGIEDVLFALCKSHLCQLLGAGTQHSPPSNSLKIILQTDIAPNMHWAHVQRYRFKNPNDILMISLHPFLRARPLSEYLGRLLMRSKMGLQLDKSEILVDDSLIYEFKRIEDEHGNEQVKCLEYCYEMPIDPRLRESPGPYQLEVYRYQTD